VDLIFYGPQNRLNFHSKVKHTLAYDHNFAFRVGKNNERLAQEPAFNLMHLLETRNIWRFSKTFEPFINEMLDPQPNRPHENQLPSDNMLLLGRSGHLKKTCLFYRLAKMYNEEKNLTSHSPAGASDLAAGARCNRINQPRWFWQPFRCLYWTILRRDRGNKESSGNS